MSGEDRAWAQQTLLLPEAVEVLLRVGVVPTGDHVQFQLEVWSTTDRTLIGMWTQPHAGVAEISSALERWTSRLREEILAVTPPFP